MNDEMKALLVAVAAHCTPTQAAAFAVLASAVRADITEIDPKSVSADFLFELEHIMIDSIKSNDGEVAHNIGLASRQMNPLL